MHFVQAKQLGGMVDGYYKKIEGRKTRVTQGDKSSLHNLGGMVDG